MTLEPAPLPPPPARCETCRHLTKYITADSEKRTCERGKPMHNDCQWHLPKHFVFEKAVT